MLSILEGLLEVLLGDWTDCALLFLHASLMAHVGVGIYDKILHIIKITLSEMGASQRQHFFL